MKNSRGHREWEDQFDILYNNITSNQAPGLNCYEKSSFLTMALEELLLDYFSPKKNKVLEGHGDSEKRDRDFSNLLVTDSQGPAGQTNLITLPDDVLLILTEELTVQRNDIPIILLVVPLQYLEYIRLMNKPFKRPTKWLAWRILKGPNKYNLIAGYGDIIDEYIIRYIKKPLPIILGPFEDAEQTINGHKFGDAVFRDLVCEFDETMHMDIIKRACELAKASFYGDLTTQIGVGNTSATEAGYLTRQ